MIMSEKEFYSKTSEFIMSMENNRDKNISVINHNDNLWDLGLMNSFSVVELVLFLEDFTQTSIELDANMLGDLHTLKRIYSLVDNRLQEKK